MSIWSRVEIIYSAEFTRFGCFSIPITCILFPSSYLSFPLLLPSPSPSLCVPLGGGLPADQSPWDKSNRRDATSSRCNPCQRDVHALRQSSHWKTLRTGTVWGVGWGWRTQDLCLKKDWILLANPLRVLERQRRTVYCQRLRVCVCFIFVSHHVLRKVTSRIMAQHVLLCASSVRWELNRRIWTLLRTRTLVNWPAHIDLISHIRTVRLSHQSGWANAARPGALHRSLRHQAHHATRRRYLEPWIPSQLLRHHIQVPIRPHTTRPDPSQPCLLLLQLDIFP